MWRLKFIAMFACILSISDAFASPIHVHIWIKAFVPSQHPVLKDYFLKTAKNTWVIEAPSIPLPGANIGKLPGTCFVTDNRSFDQSPLASARVTTEFDLVIDQRNISVQKFSHREIVRIGQTENVDCKSGETLQPPMTANTNTVTIGDVKQLNFLKVFNIRAASPNPFYKLLGRQVAPDINYEFVFQYDILTRTLKINGVTGYFPSFESYYSIDNGPIKTIIQWTPFKDSTAMSLLDLGTGVNTRSFEIKIQTH